MRPGSERNRAALRALGVTLHHGDIRLRLRLRDPARADVVVDAAANPKRARRRRRPDVEPPARRAQSRRHAQRARILPASPGRAGHAEHQPGLLDPAGCALPVRVGDDAFEPDPDGADAAGPGCARRRRELLHRPAGLALRRHQARLRAAGARVRTTFGFPVWVNRCGVLAGAGQFGRADQGIFAYWVNSWLRRRPLRYIGFGGRRPPGARLPASRRSGAAHRAADRSGRRRQSADRQRGRRRESARSLAS